MCGRNNSIRRTPWFSLECSLELRIYIYILIGQQRSVHANSVILRYRHRNISPTRALVLLHSLVWGAWLPAVIGVSCLCARPTAMPLVLAVERVEALSAASLTASLGVAR